MTTELTTVGRVRLLIQQVLCVAVPRDDADLMGSGLIDSLALVAIISEIEDEFRLELPLDDLDVDQFRSVERIAEFVAKATVPAA